MTIQAPTTNSPPEPNVFSLEGRSLKLETAADVEAHVGPLRSNPSVTEIRLGGNTFGVEACAALGSILETKKSLQIANLDDIFTSRLHAEIPPSLSSLLTALLALPNLHTVDLSDNAFGVSTQAPLVAFLSAHTPLQHLILNNNGLGPRAGTLIADALTSLHAKKEAARKDGTQVPHLETFVCGRNRLEAGSMAAWARAFAANNQIRTVKMIQNGIRQEGIVAVLRDGLSHLDALEVLDLQDNTFTALGSRALATALPKWPALRELGVGDCLLSARGGVLVAEALAAGKNESLEVLRLQYNDITSKSLAEFSRAAKDGLKALRRVELNGNRFDEEDTALEDIREVLSRRKEATGRDGEGEWGIDSLSDLEEESEDEEDEEEEEEEEEREQRAEKVVQDAEKAEEEEVAQDKDKEVDGLAEKLGKTGL